MTVGYGFFALAILLVPLVAAISLLIHLIARRPPAGSEADRWAGTHGLRLTSTSAPWVGTYLRTGRQLRFACTVGGIVVPPAAHAATGLDLHLPGLVWMLAGYLAGCVWAELSLTRPPLGARRGASLASRRLPDYLPRRIRVAQVVFPAVAVAVALVVVASGHWFPIRPSSMPSFTTTTPLPVLRRGAILSGVMAPLIMAGIWALERYLVRRPQPLTDPDLVAADDAMRSSSAHRLAASGLSIVSLIVAWQFAYLVQVVAWGWSTVFGMAIAGGFLAAFLVFRYWRDRPWQVEHHDAPPAATRSTSVAVGASPDAGARDE